MENNSEKIIDISKAISILIKKKVLFLKVMVITFVLSAAYILPEPRTYSTTLTLAPEVSSMSAGGGALGDLAASFGVDLGGMQSVDAIYPTLYPDIMQSTDFMVELFDVPVVSFDGEVKTTYYDYMATKQKMSFWKVPFNNAKNYLSKMFDDDETVNGAAGAGTKKADPTRLNKKQFLVTQKIVKNITCTVDKKTNVITIVVDDQDKLICKTMADSVCQKLQAYIIDYKTNKVRNDVVYYQKLVANAEKEYNKSKNAYVAYADSHSEMSLPSSIRQMEDLENRMQLSYNSFTAYQTQLQSAISRLQERTPSFKIIQSAVVPLKPTGPKRVIFVAGMMLLAFAGTLLYQYQKQGK